MPILIVQHLHCTDGGRFARQLNGNVPLTVTEPCDKEEIVSAHVYVAPADYHLFVEKAETVALSTDERVNWSRPSIDVLFESAARVWGAGLIGVVLSGANRDGAAGIRMIADHGGLTIAQNPKTAERPEMPLAAIKEAPV